MQLKMYCNKKLTGESGIFIIIRLGIILFYQSSYTGKTFTVHAFLLT